MAIPMIQRMDEKIKQLPNMSFGFYAVGHFINIMVEFDVPTVFDNIHLFATMASVFVLCTERLHPVNSEFILKSASIPELRIAC